MDLPGWGNPHGWVVVPYVGEGSEREKCGLLSSLLAFNHFFRCPQANWALLVLIAGWVGLCTFQDPMGSSNGLSYETRNSSCCCNLHRFLQVLRLYFPGLCNVSHSPVVPPSLSLHECATTRSASHYLAYLSASHHLATCPLCISCPFLPLLLVWINVSSLTPWLSDFHIVWFSGSSHYFLFLNWLLSFFWLYEEAKRIYLCLHLGQGS